MYHRKKKVTKLLKKIINTNYSLHDQQMGYRST